ncbi:hypothetical protein EYF80_055891 [Liparis tanakae]|uniref:Uncharacterized protein n=1 Tax=Liparis tanakae TaxID=230148 RepID=A0A4Z2EYA4_9TELE|nr:hypothetical protein EYF80_055891 [Liparis tanakae]
MGRGSVAPVGPCGSVAPVGLWAPVAPVGLWPLWVCGPCGSVAPVAPSSARASALSSATRLQSLRLAAWIPVTSSTW